VKLDDKRKRHDRFYRQAKREAFAARSVYKLEEMDRRFHILRPGARVLDLGCRPGSWLQYAARIVGPQGALVGIDRTPLEIVVPGARILTGDVFEVPAETLRGELPGFDVVLSDMAPDTSGVRTMDQARSEGLFERALQLAEELLLPRGNFVGKLFQGPDWQRLIQEVRLRFAECRTAKPEGTRKESIEQYVIGLNRKS
jgi:23S rRNA (uridine2552-2'-O)-methyltransferase